MINRRTKAKYFKKRFVLTFTGRSRVNESLNKQTFMEKTIDGLLQVIVDTLRFRFKSLQIDIKEEK